MGWDQEADGDITSIRVRYYCTRCEDMYIASPTSPGRCPMCHCDARYILGPMTPCKYGWYVIHPLTLQPIIVTTMDKWDKKRKEKYKGKLNR